MRIETGVLWSDILIESSGGSDPISSHGHRKADALRIKELIERAQEVLYYLNELLLEDKIPRLMVFLDSPMAIEATRIVLRHPHLDLADQALGGRPDVGGF